MLAGGEILSRNTQEPQFRVYCMSSSIEYLLSTYPRPRPPLSERHEALYLAEYSRNRGGKSGLSAVVAHLEAWMHRRVATGGPGRRIMELGAGTLNHVPYETNFSVYDVVEPFRELWESSPYRQRVTSIHLDVSEIPSKASYDQIISIAVLEHLTELPRTVARCALLLNEGGEFRAGIPTEGGLLWGLAWRMTTGISFRLRTGLSYKAIMRHEHLNQSDEILSIMRYLFRSVEFSRFPFPAKHVSFYTVLRARNPHLDRCASLL